MLDNISIKKRWTGILVMLGVTALVVGVYAGQTISILGQVAKLKKQKPEILAAPSELQSMQEDLQELDQEIKSLQASGITIVSHAGFIAYAEGLCRDFNLKMYSLPVEERTKMEDYDVASIRFSVEGSYPDILRFIYQMEQQDQVASVENLSIGTETIRINEEKTNVTLAHLRVNRLLQVEK